MYLAALVLLCAGTGLWVVPPVRAAARPAEFRAAPPRLRAAQEWIAARLRTARGAPQRDQAALIGACLVSVAARLRAGQGPAAAWAAAVEKLPPGLGAMLQDPAQVAAGPAGGAIYAAQAATRLAQDLGADLAVVLDACAEGIEEAARVSADRQVAFAAPRATARVLLALPLIGLGISAVMGTRPWSLFTQTWWGAGVAIVGAFFFLVGRWWIARLLRHASTSSGA